MNSSLTSLFPPPGASPLRCTSEILQRLFVSTFSLSPLTHPLHWCLMSCKHLHWLVLVHAIIMKYVTHVAFHNCFSHVFQTISHFVAECLCISNDHSSPPSATAMRGSSIYEPGGVPEGKIHRSVGLLLTKVPQIFSEYFWFQLWQYEELLSFQKFIKIPV